MTPAVYIIGGAGSGKSTLTQSLLTLEGYVLEPELRDFQTTPNARGMQVTLRGHLVTRGDFTGLYLGVMRDQFPGTDGLDRASSLPGEEWLLNGGADQVDFILAEGNTLGTRRFLTALEEHADLLLVHLTCSEQEAHRRFAARRSTQPETFVKNTVTRARNLAADMAKLGVRVLHVDTEDAQAQSFAFHTIANHLEGAI